MILLFLLISLAFPGSLELCYKAYYFIFPVGYSCNTYELKDDRIVMRGFSESRFLGSLIGKVLVEGSSISTTSMESLYFRLLLKTGKRERYHEYVFFGKEVEYSIRIKKGKEEKTLKGRVPVKKPVDPYLASLIVLLGSSEEEKKLDFFYDGRNQRVIYRVVGKEVLERLGRTWRTLKVEAIPQVKTSGLLVPKGKWYLWIEEESLIPVRMKVSFTLGSANVWIESIKGDTTLLKRLRDSAARIP
ncbi:MAG: DUF3108 domain-containing protein [Aquificae bacterium]|nr:DUF3108 domain-containing protein [Aquificota bacterium]